MTRKALLAGILAATVAVALIAVMVLSDNNDRDTSLDVRAAIVEADAPVSVRTSSIEPDNDLLYHEVIVTWNGDTRVRLDDARFTHHVAGDQGDLVTAGRGCGAQWDAERSMVVHPCTRDLRLVDLEPGESHAYPVHVYPELARLRLAPGVYVVEEVIRWSEIDSAGSEVAGGQSGEFTVRLAYEAR